MDHTERALQELERRQKAPVEDPKKGLAPTRAAAEKALAEAGKLVAAFAPRWKAMQARANRAAQALGLSTLPISAAEYFREAFGDGQGRGGLVIGAPQTFEAIIRQIDHLSEYEVVQGIHRELPGRLQAVMSNLGALAKLDRKIEQEVEILEQAAVQKAGS